MKYRQSVSIQASNGMRSHNAHQNVRSLMSNKTVASSVKKKKKPVVTSFN